MFERLRKIIKKEKPKLEKRTITRMEVANVPIPKDKRVYVHEKGNTFAVGGAVYRIGSYYSVAYGSMMKSGFYERAIQIEGPLKGEEYYPGIDYERTDQGIGFKRRRIRIERKRVIYERR